MSPTKNRTLSRRERGTVNEEFQVRFVERRYDAFRTWYNYERERYVSGLPLDRYRLLAREESVKNKIDLAHGIKIDLAHGTCDLRDSLGYGDDARFLTACVSTACPLRSWEMVEFKDCTTRFVLNETEFAPSQSHSGRMLYSTIGERRANVKKDLHAMADGDWFGLSSSCPQCGNKRPIFPYKEIATKWIYVFREAGRKLIPVQEICVEHPSSGKIYAVLENGHFVDRHYRKYEGYLDLPDLTRHTWHFFLSPKRLGRKALEALCDVSDLDGHFEQKRVEAGKLGFDVPLISSLQPWAATVSRRFSREQLKVPLGEYIPLVDPFSWTHSAAVDDYEPILQAQGELAMNPVEQAKLFVASAVSEFISHRPEENHRKGVNLLEAKRRLDRYRAGEIKTLPPPHEDIPEKEVAHAHLDPDLFKLKDQLRSPPPGAGASSVAASWVERYSQLTRYLAREADQACCRMLYPAVFSPGHRVIEIACQEHPHDTGFLAFGMSHWVDLLKSAGLAHRGRIFIRLLARGDWLAESIPQKNLLNGDQLGPSSDFIRAVKPGLPAQLFALLAAACVRVPSKAAAEFKEHLDTIGIQSYKLSDKEVELADKTLEAGIEGIDEYLERVDEILVNRGLPTRVQSKADRFMILGPIAKQAEMLTTLLGILIRLHEWNEKTERPEFDLEKVEGWKDFAEVVQIGSKLLSKPAKFALQEWVRGLKSQIQELKTSGRMLTIDELETIGSNARWIRRSGTAIAKIPNVVEFLEGPFGLILSAVDVVLETGFAVEAADKGDLGAMWGHILIATGAFIGMAPGVAILTGTAETLPWVGPAGIVASVIMASGAVLVATCSKSELQLFVSHCFLGKEFNSDVQPAQKALDQRIELLRMLSNYSARAFHLGNVASCYIYPQLIPEGGRFNVSVEFRPVRQSQAAPKPFVAMILPEAHTVDWGESPPVGSDVLFKRTAAGQLESINIRIPIHPGVEVEVLFYSQLVLEPGGKFTIPQDIKLLDKARR